MWRFREGKLDEGPVRHELEYVKKPVEEAKKIILRS